MTLEQIWPQNLKVDTKFSGLARDVMRLAQVSRDLAVEREIQARINDERQERIRRLEEARAQAEAAKAEAERVKLEAERMRAEAELSKARAEVAKADAEKAERAAAEERARREEAARQAEAAQLAAKQREEAAILETERARAETERARQAAESAKRERDAALQKLYVRLSEILDTKRETRGFIVNLGDVLFDTGRATLKPQAREKLSKLAGILVAYLILPIPVYNTIWILLIAYVTLYLPYGMRFASSGIRKWPTGPEMIAVGVGVNWSNRSTMSEPPVVDPFGRALSWFFCHVAGVLSRSAIFDCPPSSTHEGNRMPSDELAAV